jgi:hypothetical protein
MDALARLTHLESLHLDYGEITDTGFAKLAPLTRLTTLSLDSTHITDAAIPTLLQFRSLRRLNLYHTLITPAGLAHLKAALPACDIVADPASALPTRRRS